MGTLTIIGAGNVGQAIAGHMTLLGHEVRLVSPWDAEFQPLRDRGGIILSGDVEGTAMPALLTSELADAVQDAAVIVVAAPAFAHRDISRQLARIVEPDQLVLFQPSALGSGLQLSNALADVGRPRCFIAETGTSLYTCRMRTPGHVHIARLKPSVTLGATPYDTVDVALSRLQPFFGDRYRAAADALTVGMSRIGSIYHVPPALLNLSVVESGLAVPHNTLATPRVSAIIDALDHERLTLARALDTEATTFRDFLEDSYGVSEGTLSERIRDSYGPLDFPAPNSTKHRYFTEDIPFNVLVWKSLADQIGLPMPLTDAILALSAVTCDTDWHATGRTASDLGLEGANADAISHAFRSGNKPDATAPKRTAA